MAGAGAGVGIEKVENVGEGTLQLDRCMLRAPLVTSHVVTRNDMMWLPLGELNGDRRQPAPD